MSGPAAHRGTHSRYRYIRGNPERISSYHIKEDELAHEAELERYGISSPSSLVSGSAGNFYPVLRQKVLKSWERIYSVMPSDANMIVGLAWELRSEWLR